MMLNVISKRAGAWAGLAMGLVGALPAAGADPAPTIAAPVVHENMAVYVIRGPSTPGPVPLTLQEALAAKTVAVHETGRVQQLELENSGDQPVFVQLGDIVKGGRQDRVLTVSLLVPPHSGRIPIAAYCVEQGRWTARGREDAAKFSLSDAQLPSREAKVALVAPASEPAAPQAPAAQRVTPEPNVFRAPIQRRSSGGPDKQAEIWRSVGETQRLLAGNLAAPVASDKSRTSLQLTLESERLKAAQAAFVTALETPVGETGDAVGVVIAVNGRIASAEIYPSHALFAKMWPKLLRAGVTEALASRPTGAVTAPPVAAVEQFLRDAETGKASERAVATFARTETRTSTGALRVEASKADGAWVHRSYLAK